MKRTQESVRVVNAGQIWDNLCNKIIKTINDLHIIEKKNLNPCMCSSNRQEERVPAYSKRSTADC